MKPISSGELKKIFEGVKADIDRERDEKQNIDKLRKYYMESLPVLRENFYTSLIEGRIPGEKIEKYSKDYRIQIAGPYYVVTVLHINSASAEMEPFLLAVSVRKLAEEQVGKSETAGSSIIWESASSSHSSRTRAMWWTIRIIWTGFPRWRTLSAEQR